MGNFEVIWRTWPTAYIKGILTCFLKLNTLLKKKKMLLLKLWIYSATTAVAEHCTNIHNMVCNVNIKCHFAAMLLCKVWSDLNLSVKRFVTIIFISQLRSVCEVELQGSQRFVTCFHRFCLTQLVCPLKVLHMSSELVLSQHYMTVKSLLTDILLWSSIWYYFVSS